MELLERYAPFVKEDSLADSFTLPQLVANAHGGIGLCPDGTIDHRAPFLPVEFAEVSPPAIGLPSPEPPHALGAFAVDMVVMCVALTPPWPACAGVSTAFVAVSVG